MSKVYVANENGDWWTMEEKDVLYVMTEKQLAKHFGGVKNIENQSDKLERVIMEYGYIAVPMVNTKNLI